MYSFKTTSWKNNIMKEAKELFETKILLTNLMPILIYFVLIIT